MIGIEIFFVKFDESEDILYERDILYLNKLTEDPDDTVLKYAESKKINPYFVHSTSWRYEEVLIITYIVLFKSSPIENLKKMTIFEEANNTSLIKPRPEIINMENVLFHGLKHIRMLIEKKEFNRLSNVIDKEAKRFLMKLPFEIPGRFKNAYDESIL